MQDIWEVYGVPIGVASQELAGATGDVGALPYIRLKDMQYFGRLTEDVEENSTAKEEAKERSIMALSLKIEKGAPL